MEILQNCSAFYCVSFSGQRKSERTEILIFTEKSSPRTNFGNVQENQFYAGLFSLKYIFLFLICSMSTKRVPFDVKIPKLLPLRNIETAPNIISLLYDITRN